MLCVKEMVVWRFEAGSWNRVVEVVLLRSCYWLVLHSTVNYK